MSQPVIIKNKIVYGYMDKATVCRDMGRGDYNDLTEAQQLNGDVCFIQGVDASAFAPTNSLWNKVGTTPLDSELPADCSNAINQIKSNLDVLSDYSTTEQAVGKWIDGKTLYRVVYTCESFSISQSSTYVTHTVYTAPSNTEIIKYSCILNHSASRYMLPYTNGNKTSCCVGMRGTTPNIQIRVVNDSWTNITVTSEVYYTKNS